MAAGVHTNENLRLRFLREAKSATVNSLRDAASMGEDLVVRSMRRLGYEQRKYKKSWVRGSKPGGGAYGNPALQGRKIKRIAATMRSFKTSRRERLAGLRGERKTLRASMRLSPSPEQRQQLGRIEARFGVRRSEPGEPPGVVTGWLRGNIDHEVDATELKARFGSNIKYDPYLESGTGRMAARPHYKPVVPGLEARLPEIVARRWARLPKD